MRRLGSLQTRITGLVVAVILFTLAIVGYRFNALLVHSVEDSMGKNALDVARLIAELPDIRSALHQPDPSRILQPRTQELKALTHADFIVITDDRGIRYTHNDEGLIGKPFTGGDEGPALKGQTYISRAVGISGPSIRAFVPIVEDGVVRAVVIVGMFKPHVYQVAETYLYAIGGNLAIGLAVGIVLAILLARRIKRTMHGLEPDEIARLFRERQALLECLHEGVIAVDKGQRVTLVNESARRLLSIGEDAVGRPIADIIPATRMGRVLETGEPESNAEMTIHDVTVIVNRAPIQAGGEVVGAVATLRDTSEVRALAEELTGVKQYMEGLRAKTHEFMNRLQTVAGLLEMEEYEEAKRFITRTQRAQQEALQFLTRRVRDPKTSALLLGKLQLAEEKHVALIIEPGTRIGALPPTVSDAVVHILGNLIDNAIDACQDVADPEVTVALMEEPDRWWLSVEDNGCGMPENVRQRAFQKYFTTKSHGRGIGLHLVRQQVEDVLRGTLHLHTEPGAGTSFVVEIPRAPWEKERGGPTC
ncbi:sensor histidine kinase [Alicyclobacillus sp.]|uniref:sensor histidine kinase n=1 Tax=Alicyclobacillus sp. TaxID=61169 RepID=UPI0025C0F30E|nr:sensor histidine kinase [Alicyclobacillus sp.]MCL6517439.1 sensor histidine kinase [Alicyclobacillus sp.]